MTQHVVLSERAVWVIGEILEVEANNETIDEVLNVEKVKPLNHIWGEYFVTEMRRIRFKRA
jgi:hypothetical protein